MRLGSVLTPGDELYPAVFRKHVCTNVRMASASCRLLIHPKETLTAPVGLQVQKAEISVQRHRLGSKRQQLLLACE